MVLQKVRYGDLEDNYDVICVIDHSVLGGEFTVCGNALPDSSIITFGFEAIGKSFSGTIKDVTCLNCKNRINYFKNFKMTTVLLENYPMNVTITDCKNKHINKNVNFIERFAWFPVLVKSSDNIFRYIWMKSYYERFEKTVYDNYKIDSFGNIRIVTEEEWLLTGNMELPKY